MSISNTLGVNSGGNVIFEATDISVSYSAVAAVQNISIRLHEGKLTTIIGANGAGKSSLLNFLMGLIKGAGSIKLFGEEIADLPVEDRVGRGLTLVPEKRELWAEMSVADNLILGGYHRYRSNRQEVLENFEIITSMFPKLKERHSQLAGSLSGGERQVLAIGRALMGKPKILMLDEPSLGLDPIRSKDVFALIKRLKESGVSVLLVEQNATAALAIADYAYVLDTGSVVLEGHSVDVANDKKVIQAYLGI